MLRTYFKVAIATAAAFVFASCNNDSPVVEDNVQVNGETELVFTQEDTADKTVTFSANTDWTVAGEAEWFTVTPATGTAGENLTLTVSLNEAETGVERTENVVIAAGDATASFSVTQKATVYAESFAVQGNHRVVVDYTTPLTVVPTPANGKLAAVTYVSSNPEFATVDENGVVTAVAVGEATITVTAGELVQEFWVEVTEEFITDGVGRTYTFADLAAIEYSGVVKEGDAYVITADWDLSETDVWTLGDAKRVIFNDGVRVYVYGMVDFAATEEVVFTAAEEAVPDPIYFSGDVEGAGVIKNMTLIGVPVRYFGVKDMTIENCKFTGITDREPCINLGGDGLVTVSDCEFIENAYPAIAGAANTPTPLIFQDNYLYKNSADASNRPQINVTVAGDGICKILNNTVIGPAEITKNGGIAVSNLMGLSGTNKVEISGNKVSDCRYGITLNGVMDAVINDNILKNNCYESNPNNGGSGVSLYNSNGGMVVYMSGNHIEGHLWGITNIGNTTKGTGPVLNMGNLTEGDDYNPGGNVFINNGNNDVLYDLYNNTPLDVMAQGNTWNVAVQNEASIEEVIVHKKDNEALGLVTFMPAASAE